MTALMALLFIAAGLAGAAAVAVTPLGRAESIALRVAFVAIGLGVAAYLLLGRP